MDIFKSPWKPSILSSPLLGLSSSRRKGQKEPEDRYCLGGLNRNLFGIESEEAIGGDQKMANGNESNEKDQTYLSMLIETCTAQSNKKHKKSQPLGYCSKIKRQGYLFEDFQSPCLDEPISVKYRNLPQEPYRVLNAPCLKDDFYTSLLDWSPEDVVSVVLDNAAYIWNSKQNNTQKLVQGFISSIKWGKGLMIGQETGKIRNIDAQKGKQIHRNRIHQGRIGTIDCMGNLVVSGSKDCNVLVWDVRSKEVVNKSSAHSQQICGVKFSHDGNMVASGGNDNIVSVWDLRGGKALHRFNQHTAAVKALAWNPHQNYILATGGGTVDKSIRIWGLNQGKCINKIDTGSQVCNMMYSTCSNELVSTHGYSTNSINIWHGKTMENLGSLRGHQYRVLYLAGSPNGESIVTGSGDQTLRFWKAFTSSAEKYNRASSLEAKNLHLR